MKFPTTYPVGTLVQIISAAEFDALPKDDDGYARFSDLFSNSITDYMSPERRSLCGSIVRISRKLGVSDICFLKPYDLSTAVDPSAAAKFSWNSALFTSNEFHPYDTPVPISPVSFDDFLKGGI
mgnify:CR=1 FL=1|jgi:hypothetical protein